MSISIQKDVSFRTITFYGVGGLIDELYSIKTIDGFDEIWAETQQEKIPFFVLGKGSNTLFSDKGFRGRVFLLQCQETYWKTKNIVCVETGKNWQQFIEETNQKGFRDLCPLSGIPGNVGGFIRGNAGAFGMETSDRIIEVEYRDEYGLQKRISQKDCGFGYRESIFKHHPEWCITKATFGFHEESDPAEALASSQALLKERWEKYPKGRSGGSFFKNPDGYFTGQLFDTLGAKGDQIGMAQISEKHANFIINKEGKATQSDILQLARKWKQKVYDVYGLTLEAEISICDEYGHKIVL